MFNTLSEKIRESLTQLSKKAQLTEANITPALQEVRLALLEADAAVPVVRSLMDALKERALGEKVQKSLNPGQSFIRIVHREIVKTLGETQQALNLRTRPPAVIMMIGLQGSGKTTNLAKTALWLSKRNKKKVLLCSLDLSRPAAIEQLSTLAKQAEIDFYYEERTILELAQKALDHATLGGYDCLLLDTAGRTQTDQALMKELKEIHEMTNPIETLYVLDAMGGQDAIRVAAGFKETLPITGIFASKLDSTARGGAILSVQHLLNTPVKLAGNGERLTDIMSFDPTSIANRILGMSDVLSVIKQAEMSVDTQDAKRLAKASLGKKRFNFNDLKVQLLQMEKMGGFSSIVGKMGINKQIAAMAMQQLGDKQAKKFIAFIDSMTPFERKNPELLNGSRKIRISKGAGSNMQEFNQMLKRFKQLQKMMGKNQKQQKLMQRFNTMLGSRPPALR